MGEHAGLVRPWMRHGAGRDRENRQREKQSRASEVKEAFDDVDGNLAAERQAGLLCHQVGPHRVGDASDQRHGGKANDLRSQQRERPNFLVVPQQPGPANGAKEVGQVDAADAESDLAPIGLDKLRAELSEAELLNAVAS